MADRSLTATLARDDRGNAARAKIRAQPVGVVTLVRAQAADPPGGLGQHRRGGRYVNGVAGRQQKDAGTAEDVGEYVDLARLTPVRRADSLRTSPPFPP